MKNQDGFFKTQFRIPADIYGEIKDLAYENDRSINGQLVYLLRIALNQVSTPVPEDRLREIIQEELAQQSKQ